MTRSSWYPRQMAGSRDIKPGADDAASAKPVLETDEERLRFLDALHHEAAIEASEDPSPPTAEELEDEQALASFVDKLMRTPPRR